MSEPFLGEIRAWAFDKIPRGWLACAGQQLPINQNQALFAVIGTRYGGNGVTTFALPDLRGRVGIHNINTGTPSGEEQVTLTTNAMPAHIHLAVGGTSVDGAFSAVGNTWGTTTYSNYAPSPNTTMASDAVSTAGSSAPHPNMQPYLVMSYCIATVGIFPSHS